MFLTTAPPDAGICRNQTNAYIIGAGLDLSKGGQFEISSQVAIPAGLDRSQDLEESKPRSFIVVSAEGREFLDAGQRVCL